jgi:hypothetical protein
MNTLLYIIPLILISLGSYIIGKNVGYKEGYDHCKRIVEKFRYPRKDKI